MANKHIKFLQPFIVAFLMTLIMSFVGIYVNNGFDKYFLRYWFKSFLFMLPIAYLAGLFIIPFSIALLNKFFNKNPSK